MKSKGKTDECVSVALLLCVGFFFGLFVLLLGNMIYSHSVLLRFYVNWRPILIGPLTVARCSAGEELEEVHPGEHGADGGAQADGPRLHLAAAGRPTGQVARLVYSLPAFFPMQSNTSVTSCVYVFRVTEEVTARLLKSAAHPIERDGIVATRLCTHKDDVELTNENKLKQLPGLLDSSRLVSLRSRMLSFSQIQSCESNQSVWVQKYSSKKHHLRFTFFFQDPCACSRLWTATRCWLKPSTHRVLWVTPYT